MAKTMRHPLNSKVWTNRSQQIVRNPNVIIPGFNTRLTKTVDQFVPMPNQHNQSIAKDPIDHHDEYLIVDKAKAVQTGKWVLNVIAAKEEYQKMVMPNTNLWYTDTKQQPNKKPSVQSRKTSKVELIEQPSTQFVHTKLYQKQKKQNKNQNKTRVPNETAINPIAILDNRRTPLSSFSSATQVHDIESLERSMAASREKRINESRDCSTEEFRNSDQNTCLSKRMVIIITIISALFIVGIIVAILVTILTTQNSSTDSSAKSDNIRLISISSSSQNNFLCPTPIFNLTDLSCNGKFSYNYYSCYQMAASNSFTLRFSFEHDTTSGHWYFDSISAVQNNNIQLITNGDFESNLTGWIVNISSLNSMSDIHIDTTTGLAYAGSAYLYAASTNIPSYIEQKFQVIQGEYINVSFWWKYDGGLQTGRACEAIGQLITSI